ncbi:uncharacterized protein METZ01_LOCUS412149, partial [marine metagenome]
MPGTSTCTSCDAHYPADDNLLRCSACDAPLLHEPDGKRIFPVDEIATRPAEMWRYREALPPFHAPVRLGESVTPLVPFQVAEIDVLAKCEYCLPTGSYKDRGAAVLTSFLAELGVQEAVEDSSGNAGAALAGYCASAGIALRVFCPESASIEKLTQIRLYGATLERVPGPRAAATEALH